MHVQLNIKKDTLRFHGSFERTHRYKILNFKNNAWFKMHVKD